MQNLKNQTKVVHLTVSELNQSSPIFDRIIESVG